MFWATPQHMPDELLLTIPPACVVRETWIEACRRLDAMPYAPKAAASRGAVDATPYAPTARRRDARSQGRRTLPIMHESMEAGSGPSRYVVSFSWRLA